MDVVDRLQKTVKEALIQLNECLPTWRWQNIKKAKEILLKETLNNE